MKLKLKDIRKEAGLTQEQLGDMIGATKRQVGAWERGENELLLSVACDICDALGCTLDELAGRNVQSRQMVTDGLSPEGRQAVEDFAEFTRQREVAERARLNRGQKGEIA